MSIKINKLKPAKNQPTTNNKKQQRITTTNKQKQNPHEQI